MASAPENEFEEFRLDRSQFSVAHLMDPDDSVEYWLSDLSTSVCAPSNFYEGPSMAIPALARDFKEFLKSLNSGESPGDCCSYLFSNLFSLSDPVARASRRAASTVVSTCLDVEHASAARL
jgi:hypothetical protein